MELIAHRGAAYEAPENSLAAIDLAVRQGATRIEIDAWLTADGQVVICHDDTTKRCTDRDLVVASSTAAELAAAKMPNGEGIPTLHQVCELIAGRARLDLELKDQRPELVGPALAVLADHGMLADSLITAFGEASLTACRSAGFRGDLGLLIGSESLALRQRAFEAWPFAAIERTGASSLSIHHRLAHPLLRRELRRRGLGLYLWMSMKDEHAPEAERALRYKAAAQVGAKGLIVGRIPEARNCLDAAGFRTW